MVDPGEIRLVLVEIVIEREANAAMGAALGAVKVFESASCASAAGGSGCAGPACGSAF
ncbi:hypothetical protein [Amycolatopsis sp. DSM 110486]|uniref:hypothetical protein n=1 Tax=Amycolatopsis sp. DSM 110486 TaxID=2865832 RepID=UPI001C69A593|nr:hypothetical protein K1T34_44240 [Amycolatopsis sp. DSM 110486]